MARLRQPDSRGAPSPEATLLLDAVRGLKTEYGHERSCKLCQGRVVSDRFLLSFPRDALGRHPRRLLDEIGGALHMPDVLRDDLRLHLDAADLVHFGYEGDPASPVVKFYLEFADRFQRAVAAGQGDNSPLPVHRAYKWQPRQSQRFTLAHYTCQPGLSVDDMMQLVRAIYRDETTSGALDIIGDLLRKATQRIPERELFFLQVSEENNPRRSFDIKLYDTEWRFPAIEDLVRRMAHHCGIAGAAANTLVESLADETPGHVSGGIGRDGKGFFTLYFGVQACG